MKYKLSYSIGFIALSLFFLVSIPSASADTKPTVTTQAVSNIGATTATGNGNVTYSGGFTITTRGIEWGTSSGIYPNSVTQNGSFGTGAFTASLINLPAGTTIYARAKAYNPLGWGYGSQISFITKSATPTGTLTPTSSSCTIVSGASSCTQTLTWTTTNPIGTSAVTSPTGTPSPVNGNSGSRSFTVPYNAAGVNFFLYNNAILLAQTKINTFCASNTTWNGSRCATNTYTVTPSAGTGGSLSPSTAQTVAYNGIKSFTVTANSGYTISSVTGCSGSLSGTTYTTGAITGACTVTAAFAAIPPPTPTATLSATSPIVSGSHSTITWTSANATSCSISPTVSLGEGGPLNGNGSTAVLTTTTTTTYTYTLTCTGAGGTTKTATATVTVTPPAPDLTASFVTPTTAIVGTAVTLSSTITNSGTASTGGGFTNLFQIADDSSGTNATVIGTSAQSSSLAANSTATASLSYAFTSYGTWYVSVCADKSSISSSGVITESNENNNCGAWTAITVAKADPDISIFTASPPNVAYGGRSVLTWKATNVSSCSAYGAWSNQGTFSGSGLTNPLTAYAIFTFQCYGFAQKGSDNKPMVTKGADVSVSAAPSSCATSGTCHTFSKTVCACADVISRGDLAFVFGKVDHTTCGGTSFSGYTYVCGTFTYNLGLNKTMYLAQGNNINDPIVVNGEFASSQSFYCNEPASCAWRSCSFSDWSCVANSGTKYDSDLKAVNDLQGSSDSIDSIYLYESLREVRSTVYPDVFLRTVDIKEVSQDSYTDYSSPPTYTVHLVRDILDQWITYPGSSSAESSISFFGDFLPVASDAYNGAEISGRSGSMIGAFTPNYGSFKIAEIKYFVTQMQDGFCSATHYSCASGGVSYNHAESSTAWTWSCSAPGGGDPSSCSEGKPDLIAGFVSPTSATTTATVLSATISNIGTGSTRAGFTNLFQKATNANGAGATDIGTSASTELAANGTSVASLSYTFPSFGTYYIRVCADKSSAGNAGVITESNENNNCGGWTTVTVSNSVTLTATPTSVAPGGHATLTWTSSNVINC
ncbi:MAG: hypothetical protein NTY93_02545, partial [Candidatus Kaiserbacteria bacterium]|nr:hypothetical protein [Candidatus Kaiserbacteria bacterium]